MSVSKFLGKFETVDDKLIDKRTRLVSMKLGSSSDLAVDKQIETAEGLEVHLRTTDNAEQSIKAYFFENSKKIKTVTIQRWMTKSGRPHKVNSIVLFGEQLDLLLKFVEAYKGVPSYGNGNIRSIPLNVALNKIPKEQETISESLNDSNVIEYLKKNPDLIKTIVENEIDEKDIVSLAYRNKQLAIFNSLMIDDNFFEDYKKDLGNNKKDEDVWQSFFELNKWIFGYGLNYHLNSSLEGKKLEQTIKGFNFSSNGKRVDALLKTQGLINSLSFGEIKTHKTPLLQNVSVAYRPECWRISSELSGSIAQVQKSVQQSILNLHTKIEMKDSEGFLTGEDLYLYHPKSFLVVGSLSEFKKDMKINEVKFSSFELFRRQINNIDILTFDELYERAKYIVDSNI